ncbi:MAG: hypothetical protein KIT39_19795 [Nitrospirales bacterium]|nr:hypothetical protein [Nitrospirales bacterium]
MSESIIQAIYNRNKEIASYLHQTGEITYESEVRDSFRKILVLSIASYFEKEVKEIILSFVRKKSQSELIPNFVERKAVERQYHNFFQWDKANVNNFLGLWGVEFKKRCQDIISSNTDLEASIRDFIELGRTRNELVHLDFANFQLPKNDEEYFALYLSAERFIRFLREQLK